MPDDTGSFGRGVLVGLGATVLGTIALAVLGMIGLIAIGILQAAWIVPTYLHYRKAGKSETAKGILLIAGIVFLLNAACWGVISVGNFRIGG
jgi:hypothetical protein